MSPQAGVFLGKYRGIVSANDDPLHEGRIRAKVTDVVDSETGWATPCAPVGGPGMGLFALPPVGAGVWMEFEGGDPGKPIWSGCWWGSAKDVPTDVALAATGKIVLQTDGGTRILLDDTPGAGGITLTTPGGQKIVLSATGIELDNGSGATLTLTAAQVSINNGALEVT